MPTKPQGHKSHSVPKYLQTLSFKNVQMWNIWKTVGLYTLQRFRWTHNRILDQRCRRMFGQADELACSDASVDWTKLGPICVAYCPATAPAD